MVLKPSAPLSVSSSMIRASGSTLSRRKKESLLQYKNRQIPKARLLPGCFLLAECVEGSRIGGEQVLQALGKHPHRVIHEAGIGTLLHILHTPVRKPYQIQWWVLWSKMSAWLFTFKPGYVASVKCWLHFKSKWSVKMLTCKLTWGDNEYEYSSLTYIQNRTFILLLWLWFKVTHFSKYM